MLEVIGNMVNSRVSNNLACDYVCMNERDLKKLFKCLLEFDPKFYTGKNWKCLETDVIYGMTIMYRPTVERIEINGMF